MERMTNLLISSNVHYAHLGGGNKQTMTQYTVITKRNRVRQQQTNNHNMIKQKININETKTKQLNYR